MDIPTITMDVKQAREQAAQYRALEQPTPEDEAILAGLLALIEGKPVIDITQTVAAGGRHDDGTPRLAIGRADWAWCWLRAWEGSVEFAARQGGPLGRTYRYAIPGGDRGYWSRNKRAMVPPVPPAHRPKRWKLPQYLILWEVEKWEPAPRPPGDPALLRPLHLNLATVEHVWDLTDLERAVLAGRT